MALLIHGTCVELAPGAQLLPHPTRVLEGTPAVFTTSKRGFALSYIANAHSDVDIIKEGFSQDGPLILREGYPGAFAHVYCADGKPKSGWLYYVDAGQFAHDARLGMSEEFVCTAAVPIVKREFVPDVLTALRASGDVYLMEFDEYARVMRAHMRRKALVVQDCEPLHWWTRLVTWLCEAM